MLNKRSLKTFMIIFSMIISLVFSVNLAWATDPVEEAYEDALFSSTAPDVFILLDATGSMKNGPGSVSKNPSKDYNWGFTSSCVTNTTQCNSEYGFDLNNTGNCKWDCSRLGIAKRAIYGVLNYNNDLLINSADESSMNVRVASGKFDASGFTKLNDIAAPYNQIMCGNKKTDTSASTYCNPDKVKAGTCYNSSTSPYNKCLAGVPINDDLVGSTPMVQALKAVKSYYDGLTDASKDCRQKFIILITDGGENKVCNTTDCSADYIGAFNRRQSVLMANNLAESSASTAAGAPKYKLLVFGINDGMPTYYQNTLNWMAFWGDPANATLSTATTVPIRPVNLGTFCCASTYTNYCPSADSGTWTPETACLQHAGTTTTVTNFYAPSNDPGNTALPSGYKGAYMVTSSATVSFADDLAKKLKETLTGIATTTFSFTQASIQAVRTTYESFVYEATFNYMSADPFYPGHVKAYAIDNDNNGLVSTTATWDAGTMLKTRTTPARVIKTLTPASTSLIDFNASNLTDALFDVSTSTSCNTGTGAIPPLLCTNIINFIVDGDTHYAEADTYYAWKLGDIFHSTPLTIATPNTNFIDNLDSTTYDYYFDAAYYLANGTCKSCSGCSKSFGNFLCDHIRTVPNEKRIILVGANDGQLHAFRANNGAEAWSFIPPNLLSKLKLLAHNQHPTGGLTHRYFVDGPLSAAEVYTGAVSSVPPIAKNASYWRTYLSIALGRGGVSNLWSSSSSCASGFAEDNNWSSGFPHYCGYYMLDVSNTLSPVYVGRIGGNSALSSTDKPEYLGEPWSKMFMGRVKIGGMEKWVGLIGGGYSGSDCKHGSCDPRGKGFFVVDLSNGAILWSYTRTTSNGMDYDLVAGPAAADYDGDGFLDTAYIGDVGKNIWRFKFCSATDTASCGVSSWSGSLLLNNN